MQGRQRAQLGLVWRVGGLARPPQVQRGKIRGDRAVAELRRGPEDGCALCRQRVV